MAVVVVIMPTRGRPERAAEVFAAFRHTAALPNTRLIMAVDRDDPTFDRYQSLCDGPANRRFGWDPDHAFLIGLDPDQTGNLVKATNTVAMMVARDMFIDAIIGNWGDDHVPRSGGWDKAVTAALASPGIAYGDDMFQHDKLPTAPFISAAIVNALGYYFLPDLEHQFVDNAVRDVGAQTDRLFYLPDVIIEHDHPFAGKAHWDEGYQRANEADLILHDHDAYYSWREHAMAQDIERVRQALAVAA